MFSHADAETIFDAVRFGEGATRKIVCPRCGQADQVHSLNGGIYECGNVNKCRTVKRREGCKFTLTAEHLTHIVQGPTCPRCGEQDQVQDLGNGVYICGGDACKELKASGGYKFRPTSLTLLHGKSNLGAYMNAANLIFSQNLAGADFNARTVGLSRIKSVCGLKSQDMAAQIRKDIYHAMQPPVLKQRIQTAERCGVGRVDYRVTDGGAIKKIKIFILCDMIADDFYITKHNYKRAATFYPTRIRIAFYEARYNHDLLLKTHFLPATSVKKGTINFIPPFIFFCPDKDKFSFSDGTRRKITGFDKSSFKHNLYKYYKEYKAMEKCIETEEDQLAELMETFSRPYKELGHFLCEYVFKRNIDLNREARLLVCANKNAPVSNLLESIKIWREGFKRGTRTIWHLYKGMLTPMMPDGLQIRKDLAPGMGFPKSSDVAIPGGR